MSISMPTERKFQYFWILNEFGEQLNLSGKRRNIDCSRNQSDNYGKYQIALSKVEKKIQLFYLVIWKYKQNKHK